MTQTVTRRPARRAGDRQRNPPTLYLSYCPAESVRSPRCHPLLVGENILGRQPDDPDAIAILEDPLLSREHAAITVKVAKPGEYQLTLRDLGSKNGTILNQVPLHRQVVPLQLQDVLRLGDSFLIVAARALTDAAVPALIGHSAVIAALRARLSELAPAKSNVLLLGETGTGKEVAARTLHELSGRPGSWVAVNCSAIPAELAESQFFGQLAGAYTGAHKAPGFFRAAHRGTLFLDEIGDLPLPLQPKLLRVLEERAITPVGSAHSEPCDVRVVAATNHDLQRAIAEGRFREDLYARLEDQIVYLPPLRTRREDILPLLLQNCGTTTLELEPDLVDALLHHGYPRNVRELLKLTEHLHRYGADEVLWQRLRGGRTVLAAQALEPSAPHLPAAHAASKASPPARVQRLVRPSRSELEDRLRAQSGVLQYAAEDLGCSPRQLRRWLAEESLDLATFRLPPPRR